MDHQDWKPVVLSKRQSDVPRVVNLAPQLVRNVESDDTVAPEKVNTDKRKRVMNLRNHLKMNQKEFAQKCCIPLPDYKALENGTLLKHKASVYISKIFNSHTKIIQENGL